MPSNNIMRQIERFGERLTRIIGSYLPKPARPEAPRPVSLSDYTYTQITQICDQTLTLSRLRDLLGRDVSESSIYTGLNKEDSPAPITTAVMIGLVRAGNLQQQEVNTIGNITSLLKAIYTSRNIQNTMAGEQYRRFCGAIERSVKTTVVMDESARPDFALSRQLASFASLSFRVLSQVNWRTIRYQPYVSSDGQIIRSREGFIASLGGGELGAACVRFAVDLGVLTTQPRKITPEEKEWCRRNKHLFKMVGNPALNERLEIISGNNL